MHRTSVWVCNSSAICTNWLVYVNASFICFAATSAIDTVGWVIHWHQEEHSACKNWVMRCWCGHLSGAKCRLFAYGPADSTAIPKPHRLLPHLNPDQF